MSLDGGLGHVTTKNVPLGDPNLNLASEALTAVPNADGTGFWVLTYTKGTAELLAFLFDSDGPADPDGGGPAGEGDPVVSVLPSPNGDNGFGTFALSPDNTELLVTTNAPVFDSGKVRLLGFDAASGTVWQKAEWAIPFGRGYAVDFSPAGNYAYATSIEEMPPELSQRGRLYRYDIASNDTGAAIKASEQILGQFTNAGYVRRGPDGRMYMADRLSTSIVVVNDPDDPANPGLGTVALAPGSQSIWGLPQTITGCPPESDLAIRKASRGPVRAGAEFTYVLEVTNNGPDEAPLAVVRDKLPGKVTYLSNDAGCDASSLPQLTCELGPLAVGASERIRVRVRVEKGARGKVRNRATVTGPNGDPSPANNEARHAKRVRQPKPRLALTKRAGAKVTHPGDVVPYTIAVRNKGTGAATGVRVCDVLPEGLAVARAPGAAKRSARRVCWRLGRLAAGAKRTLRITARVAMSARPGVLRNTAVAQARNARRASDASPVAVRPGPAGPCPGAARC
mgnify:FL=1